MGKHGPPPAPTSLKLLKGEKKSRITKNEPKPSAPRTPLVPPWLSPEAKVVWRSLAADMFKKSVLTNWDREAFAVFCEAVVHHRKACERIDGSAILVRGDKGKMVKNPALQVARDTAQTIRAFAQEFGLTPSSRSGIELPPTADFDEARRLLS
jgi:P27 family predicted phage terminase small subunit